MKSSSGSFSIAASAPRIDVDNRITLRNYYRIAHNLIKQADIYRHEKNIIDLYVMLLRFSSLITETIPSHRDYHVSLHSERNFYRKKLLNVLNELEELKPDVQRRTEELNRKSRNQVNNWDQAHQRSFAGNRLEWPSGNKQTTRNDSKQTNLFLIQDGYSRGSVQQRYKLPQTKPVEEQFRKLSFSIPRPKEETLSRHSILGPNGLNGQWQPPIINHAIQYPSNLDLTPIEIPSLHQPTKDEPVTAELLAEPVTAEDKGEPEHTKSPLEEVLSLHDSGVHTEEPSTLSTLDVAEVPGNMNIIREPSPPPVLAEVHDLAAISSELSSSVSVQATSVQDELVRAESPLQVHISTTMMDSFMRFAKSNTDRSLETCGVLAGSLKNRKFYVTTLIIPKQEGTSDSCQTTNEEEIFEYQDKHSLFPLGWIHTHPTQSCFMSSIDVHTHYSYQIMLPEAIAIVMAPRDSSRQDSWNISANSSWRHVGHKALPAAWLSSSLRAIRWGPDL
ncbi:AMSH-like ubiquitin thioesterase 1 isoform X1 [Iris pallida]|uniref:AMSH-like ubiquitin thioesterase 1 isoform X1 n=1 Tax=Iris pallida TaxID=29817 RepID=A0AAX6FUI2_IRIPA|nr:AMSH-like ubiquitin thioesterase 1 isoform X1 [Iris pallida]KAJ6833652.1 AMSH-like ubiquitin thioesterase 1 isoform X1 [Iris pallida]